MPLCDLRQPLMMMALEPRWMFDGAAVADAAHASDGSAHALPDASAKALIPFVPAAVQIRPADPAQDDGKKEVTFIDTSVVNYQSLVDGMRAGVEVELINGGQSGLAQMALWAETHSGYDAIHVLSHGGEGNLRLGTDIVCESTLSTSLAKAEWAAIGSALNAGGDLLLYGCDVARGAAGIAFIGDLSRLTGADVAASSDATGISAREGNWNLEVISAGSVIEARSLAIDGYDGLLFTGTLVAGHNLVNGLGGADDYGETTLAKNHVMTTALTSGSSDDGYWRVDVSSVFSSGFKVGSTTYSGATDFYVGTNGYVTLGHGNDAYAGVDITSYTLGPLFSAFLTDIHLDPTPAGYTDELNAIYVDKDAAAGIVTITYSDVAPISDPDVGGTDTVGEGNFFQIRLHTYGSGNFGIELRYQDMNWAGSSGNWAVAGWTTGDGATYGTVTGSGSTAAKDFETTTNVSQTGIWAWDVFGGSVGGTATTTTTADPVRQSAPPPSEAPKEGAKPAPTAEISQPKIIGATSAEGGTPIINSLRGDGDAKAIGMQTVVRETSTTRTSSSDGLSTLSTRTVADAGSTTRPTGETSFALAPTLSAPSDGGFRVAVVSDAASTGGTAIIAARPIGEVVQIGQVSFGIPADSFAVAKADTQVTLTATQADGQPLPGWLSFNPTTGRFEGTPPAGQAGAIDIKVSAKDAAGAEAVQVFKVVLRGQQGTDAGRDPGDIRNAFMGRVGLSDQIRTAKGGAERFAALAHAARRAAS
jgi:hypothetical protein